jgi:CheY-like chemotaxis protein
MVTPNSMAIHHTRQAGPIVQAGGRIHVLVLDDDPALRELFSAMLEGMGCLATTCSSSKEALDVYRSAGVDTAAIDCALIDLHIDEKADGVTVGRMMREINPKVRLVLVSGSVDPKRLEAHKSLGFDAVLPKPFNMKQLRKIVSRPT